MTEQGLREKIADTLNATEISVELEKADIYKFADALIAAGIGDVSCLKEHRVIAEYSLVPDDDNPYIIPNVPLRVTQLYSGEEVEKMTKECKELKDELRSKVEYIQEQDEVINEYKHRAARAERALHCLARSFAEAMCKDGDDTHYLVDGFIQDAYSQSEKELAEEMKE